MRSRKWLINLYASGDSEQKFFFLSFFQLGQLSKLYLVRCWLMNWARGRSSQLARHKHWERGPCMHIAVYSFGVWLKSTTLLFACHLDHLLSFSHVLINTQNAEYTIIIRSCCNANMHLLICVFWLSLSRFLVDLGARINLTQLYFENRGFYSQLKCDLLRNKELVWMVRTFTFNF